MRSGKILLLLSFLFTTSCLGKYSEDDLDDIRETVFRYQFGRPAPFYCIALDNKQDPSDELMRRFINHNPPVKKYSECRNISVDATAAVKDSRIYFAVHSISLKMGRKAEAEGSWARGPLFGETHRYLLRFEDGKWTVAEDKLVSTS